jgi:hypothetical protein
VIDALRGIADRLESVHDADALAKALGFDELRYLCRICELLGDLGVCEFLGELDDDDDDDLEDD